VLVASVVVELRSRWRDRSVLLAALVVALALPALLDLAIGRGIGADYRPRIATVAPAADPAAAAILAALADRTDLRLDLRPHPDTAAARAAVRDRRADAAIVLPDDLTSALVDGRTPRVEAITASSSPLAGEVASGIAIAVQDRLTAVHDATRAAQAAGQTPPDAGTVVRGLFLAGVDLRLRDLDGTTSPLAYFGPSITILMSIFICGASARGLADERPQGVSERWATGPAPWWVHEAGVGLGAVILTSAVSLLSWLASTTIFGVSWGAAPGVVALLVASAIAAVGMNFAVLRIAGRAGNRIDGASGAVVLLIGLFGGHFVALSQLPDGLRTLSLATPSGWSLRTFSDLVLLGEPSRVALWPAFVVASMGVVLGAISLRPARLRVG